MKGIVSIFTENGPTIAIFLETILASFFWVVCVYVFHPQSLVKFNTISGGFFVVARVPDAF